jgi:hypothetical protein
MIAVEVKNEIGLIVSEIPQIPTFQKKIPISPRIATVIAWMINAPIS